VSYPTEYENAINGLKTLRKNIERTFLSGRIKALLEASRETLRKYSEIISGKTIFPRLVGNINRYNLALTGNPTYFPADVIAQAKLKYTGDTAPFPNGRDVEPQVDRRLLPNIGIFTKDFRSDIALLEEGHEALWGQMFVIQAEYDAFGTEPDAYNSFFTYYRFSPLGREKISAPLSDGINGFTDYNQITGECTVLGRELRKVDGTEKYGYSLFVFLDADLHTSDGIAVHFPFAVINPSSNAINPPVIFVIAGKRIKSDDTGLFVGDIRDGQLVGFTKTHNTVGTMDEVTLYSSPATLTIEIDGAEYGTTDPPAGVYVREKSDPITITATPNTNCILKEWILDGRGIPPSDSTLEFTMMHDRHVIAVFKPQKSVLIVPNTIEKCDWCTGYYYGGYTSLKPDLINETHTDGKESYISIDDRGRPYTLAVFGLTDPSIPSGATIDKVVVETVWFKERLTSYTTVRIGVKTHNTIYLSDGIYVEGIYPKKYTYEFPKNPYTDKEWTISELNELQLAVAVEYAKGRGNLSTGHVWIYYREE